MVVEGDGEKQPSNEECHEHSFVVDLHHNQAKKRDGKDNKLSHHHICQDGTDEESLLTIEE